MRTVEIKNVIKKYPGVTALDDVTFTLKESEIHSLLGENGAGKSTLMKILYGLEKPSSGKIFYKGKEVNINSTLDAIELGIGMVHQHFMLAPVLTVAENIVVGAEPKGFKFNFEKAVKSVEELIEKFNFKIDPRAKVENLSVGEQQRVEILKAMYRKAEILILDEPTAVLTPNETLELFEILKKLKESGKSIILITHKLGETIAIADTISVLRRGKMISSGVPLGTVTKDELASQMVGRKVELGIKRRSKNIGEVSLKVKNLTYTKNHIKILSNISFEARKGEILGIAGVEGNGQTELIECLTGLIKPDSMDLILNENKIEGGAKEFLRSNIGHIPEDRNVRGLVGEMSIGKNIILGYHYLDEFQKNGIARKENIDSYADKLIEEYDIRTPNSYVTANSLSGGNQQKVVIARVFNQDPDLLIVAQPTRGVDVGAMEYIHSMLLQLRDRGKTIVLISSDLDELRNLSDNLLVIYEGEIVSKGITDGYSDSNLSMLMNSGKEASNG